MRNKAWLGLYISLLVVAAIVSVSIYISVQNETKVPQKAVVAEVTQIPSEAPAPTVSIAKNEYSIIVQNGSGVPGEAARLQEILEDNGYVVSSVGNADTSEYEESVIRVNRTVEEKWLTELMALVEEFYPITEEVDESADEVVIIVGSESAE